MHMRATIRSSTQILTDWNIGCANNDGHCIDDYADADSKKYFRKAKDVTLKGNQIIVDGKVIGTFEHLSFDDFSPFAQGVFDAMSAQREPTKQLIASLAAESVLLGATDFLVGKAIQTGVEAYRAYRVAKSAAETLRDLSGQTRQAAREVLKKSGYVAKGTTPGGYEKWYHPDGSRVQIRPDGEVVRTAPKADGYRPRIGPDGNRTSSHNTGERVH